MKWLPGVVALACACGPGKQPASTTQLKITVVDPSHTPIAARVLLWTADGQPLRIGSIDLYGQRQGATACQFAPGVIGTWDGIVLATGLGELPVGVDRCAPTPAIPYGHYKVWAWHGIDYEIWKGEVDVSANRGVVALEIALDRAYPLPPNVVAADMHVHAHASNDSGMPDTQRVAAQVAGGIDVIGLSNHNSNGDASAAVHALGLDGKVLSIPSNEITSEMMHAGIYPARGPSPPADKIITADPKTLMAMLRALPDHPIIQINHPRFRYQSLFDTTHWNGVSWPPPFPLDFDAVEVVPGYAAFNVEGDRRLDEGLRDFYTLYSHGHPVAAMGGSDTHDFNWVLDGTGRTFVELDPAGHTEASFLAAVRARHTVATSGPWLDVRAWSSRADRDQPPATAGQTVAARDGKVYVTIVVAQPHWMNANRVRIQVGDDPPISRPIERNMMIARPGSPAEAALPNGGAVSIALELEVGKADTFIGVAVDGDDPEPLELTGTYQRDKWKHPGVTPFAVISPILVDADGDHHWKRGDADLTY